jgi:hypothetical protein
MIETGRRKTIVNRIVFCENLRRFLDIRDNHRDNVLRVVFATLRASSFPFRSTMPTTGGLPSAQQPRFPDLRPPK